MIKENNLQNKMEIVIIANSGILINYKNTKILIDGIYYLDETISGSQEDSASIFTPISKNTLDKIINGVDEFVNLDGLLFSHFHRDHFHMGKTIECINNNHIQSILLPDFASQTSKDIDEVIENDKTSLLYMDLPFGEIAECWIKDIKIKYFRTIHCGKGLSEVEHYSFIISCDEKQVYISADADFLDGHHYQILSDETISLGFFNPLFFNFKKGRAFLSKINPPKIIMYHIPFHGDDRFGFRKTSINNASLHKETLPSYEIITKELEKYYVERS
jgi:L-ascorbate metabolism protein UlaG (beta-lactamase superfamily)